MYKAPERISFLMNKIISLICSYLSINTHRDAKKKKNLENLKELRINHNKLIKSQRSTKMIM